MDAKDEALKV